VLDYRTGFICGGARAGDLVLGVGVDAGGDRAGTSPLPASRTWVIAPTRAGRLRQCDACRSAPAKLAQSSARK